ncbi:MAG: hypothetical protein AAF557_18655 [Pseudomonadota bacterium]
MGLFGRKPRKVGFGISAAKPEPPKPTQYTSRPTSRSRAWERADNAAADQPSGIDILKRQDRSPATKPERETPQDEAKRLTMQQIETLKKRSPWLGSMAEKLVNAHARGRVGTAKEHLPMPSKRRTPLLVLAIAAIMILVFLGPFLSAATALFAGY